MCSKTKTRIARRGGLGADHDPLVVELTPRAARAPAQGLEWSRALLKRDLDGDSAHAFLESSCPDSESEDDARETKLASPEMTSDINERDGCAKQTDKMGMNERQEMQHYDDSNEESDSSEESEHASDQPQQPHSRGKRRWEHQNGRHPAQSPWGGKVRFTQSEAPGPRGGVVLSAQLPDWVRSKNLRARTNQENGSLTLSCTLPVHMGGFERSFDIDTNSLDLDSVAVRFDEGRLSVTIPGAQRKATPRRMMQPHFHSKINHFDGNKFEDLFGGHSMKQQPQRWPRRRHADPFGFGGGLFGGW